MHGILLCISTSYCMHTSKLILACIISPTKLSSLLNTFPLQPAHTTSSYTYFTISKHIAQFALFHNSSATLTQVQLWPSLYKSLLCLSSSWSILGTCSCPYPGLLHCHKTIQPSPFPPTHSQHVFSKQHTNLYLTFLCIFFQTLSTTVQLTNNSKGPDVNTKHRTTAGYLFLLLSWQFIIVPHWCTLQAQHVISYYSLLSHCKIVNILVSLTLHNTITLVRHRTSTYYCYPMYFFQQIKNA